MDKFHPVWPLSISDVYGEDGTSLKNCHVIQSISFLISEWFILYLWAWLIAWHKVERSAKKKGRKRWGRYGGREKWINDINLSIFHSLYDFFPPTPLPIHFSVSSCLDFSHTLLCSLPTPPSSLPLDLKTIPSHLWRACYCLVTLLS